MINNLSKNFTLQEFIYSDTARKYKINNIPSIEIQRNIGLLCNKLLQPLRDYLNLPIKITSGYRSPELNKKVGGSSTSQHTRGQAVDIVVKGLSIKELAKKVLDSNLVFDQMIEEYSGNTTWLHLSYNSKLNRKQYLLYDNGKYKLIK